MSWYQDHCLHLWLTPHDRWGTFTPAGVTVWKGRPVWTATPACWALNHPCRALIACGGPAPGPHWGPQTPGLPPGSLFSLWRTLYCVWHASYLMTGLWFLFTPSPFVLSKHGNNVITYPTCHRYESVPLFHGIPPFFFHPNLWSMRSMQIRWDLKMHWGGGGVNLAESIKSCWQTEWNQQYLLSFHGTPQQQIC